MKISHTRQQGFTLVEMAIVLTIIGLIIGGVVVGQELIRNSQLKSVITDYRRYVQAVQTFKDKYYALPGDMTNATTVWGSLGGTGSDTTCQNTPATGLATCNGNGNGQILTSVAASDETYRFWQHLANAGLIEGRYTGADATLSGYTNSNTAGINVPGARIKNAMWVVNYQGATVGTVSAFSADYENYLTLKSPNPGMVLTPTEAYIIDSKLDDGLPGTGSIIAAKETAATPCTTATGLAPPADAGATYNFTDTNIDCRLNFLRAF